MTRQPRLRLAQNVGEVGDGQLGLRKQRQDAQAGRFACGFERSGQRGEAQLLIRHCALPAAIRVSAYATAYKDIFISLSQMGQVPIAIWDFARVGPPDRGDPGDLPERMPLCGYGGNGRTQRSGAKRGVVRRSVRASRRRSRGRAAEGLRRLALLYRAHPHAMEAARGLPEKSARVRRGLHRRARSALGRGTDRPRDRQPRAAALLDGQGAARSFGAIAAALRRAARHLRVALAGAAEPDRGRRWRGFFASTATRFRSSVSTASTIRR